MAAHAVPPPAWRSKAAEGEMLACEATAQSSGGASSPRCGTATPKAFSAADLLCVDTRAAQAGMMVGGERLELPTSSV